MKKLSTLLNCMIGAFIGVFIGHGIYVIYDYKTRPELYAMWPAPWYISILEYEGITLIVILLCFLAKVIIKHKQKG